MLCILSQSLILIEEAFRDVDIKCSSSFTLLEASHRLEGEVGIQRGNHCNRRRIMKRGRDVKRKIKSHSIF